MRMDCWSNCTNPGVGSTCTLKKVRSWRWQRASVPPDLPAFWRSSAFLGIRSGQQRTRWFCGHVRLAWALRSLLHELVELRVHANHRPESGLGFPAKGQGPGGRPKPRPQNLRVAHHLLNHGRVHQLLPRPTGFLGPIPMHTARHSPQHHLWILHHLLLSLRLGTHYARERRNPPSKSAKKPDLAPPRLRSRGLLFWSLSYRPSSGRKDHLRPKLQSQSAIRSSEQNTRVSQDLGSRFYFFSQQAVVSGRARTCKVL